MADRQHKHRLIYGFCLIGALLEEYDLQSAGLAAPKYGPELQLTALQIGHSFTFNTLGLLFGAILGGLLSDRLGRRVVLIAAMISFGVFSIGSALSDDLTTLVIMRFLTGVGLGGAMPNLIVYISETSRGDRVAAKVAVMTAAIPAGGAIGGFLLFLTDMGWRTIFHVGGWAPLVLAAAMIWRLPESGSFLEARAARHAGQAVPQQRRQPLGGVLFGGARGPVTLSLWTCMLGTLTCLYLLLNWMPTLLIGKGLERSSATLVTLAFSVGGAMGAVMLGALMARMRRSRLFVFVYVAMAMAVWLLSRDGASVPVAFATSLVAGLFVVGAQFLLYGLTPTFYPLAVRGAGVGSAIGVGRLGAVLGPLMAGWILSTGADAGVVIFALVPIIALSLAAALAMLHFDHRNSIERDLTT